LGYLAWVQIVVVFCKYAFYQPNQELKAASIFHLLLLFSLLVPFLFPLPIILGIYFYPKAIRNVAQFL